MLCQPTILIPDPSFKDFSSPAEVIFQTELVGQWLDVRPLPEYKPELTGWPAFLLLRYLNGDPTPYRFIQAVNQKQTLESDAIFIGAYPWKGELLFYFYQASSHSLPLVPLIEYQGHWRL